jgi:hypothetical protein
VSEGSNLIIPSCDGTAHFRARFAQINQIEISLDEIIAKKEKGQFGTSVIYLIRPLPSNAAGTHTQYRANAAKMTDNH